MYLYISGSVEINNGAEITHIYGDINDGKEHYLQTKYLYFSQVI